MACRYSNQSTFLLDRGRQDIGSPHIGPGLAQEMAIAFWIAERSSENQKHSLRNNTILLKKRKRRLIGTGKLNAK
jgi:hypothetical protein